VFDLEDNCCCSSTGYSRSASKILKDQDERSRQNDSAILDQLHYVKELAYQSKNALECAIWRNSPILWMCTGSTSESAPPG